MKATSSWPWVAASLPKALPINPVAPVIPIRMWTMIRRLRGKGTLCVAAKCARVVLWLEAGQVLWKAFSVCGLGVSGATATPLLALLAILISLADVEARNQRSRDSCSREPIFRRWGIDQPLLPTPSKPPHRLRASA